MMYCPKCRITMKGDAQGFYKCVTCGHVAHDLVNRVVSPAADDAAGQSFLPLLAQGVAALTQIASHLARIATALEDRPASSPLDALRAAHPDWTWTPHDSRAPGDAYEGRQGDTDVPHDYIILRRNGERWTATRWHGLVMQGDHIAPIPDGAVALLLGTATTHTFTYRNHEGVTRTVRILDGTQSLTTEHTDHYPHGGLKVRAWDVDRNDWRVYDMARVGG